MNVQIPALVLIQSVELLNNLALDNPLRRVEGQRFWLCSGRFEVVVLFGMLSLVAQFVYWSRIVSGLNQEPA
jgi:hypothetical protein